jgi:hypothetical protein
MVASGREALRARHWYKPQKTLFAHEHGRAKIPSRTNFWKTPRPPATYRLRVHDTVPYTEFMVFRGTFQNGRVIFDESVDVPNGTPADVRLIRAKRTAKSRPKKTRSSKNGSVRRPRKTQPSLLDELAPFIGALKGLPPDASRNVDHYLYGARKR